MLAAAADDMNDAAFTNTMSKSCSSASKSATIARCERTGGSSQNEMGTEETDPLLRALPGSDRPEANEHQSLSAAVPSACSTHVYRSAARVIHSEDGDHEPWAEISITRRSCAAY